MNKIKDILFILLILVSLVLLYRIFFASPDPGIPPEEVDQMLDETTRVLSSQIQDRQAIIDSIRTTSQAQADRIQDLEEQVVSYSRVHGRLNLVVDSLEQKIDKRVPLGEIILRDEEGAYYADTTLTFTETYSDSLLLIRSHVDFHREWVDHRLEIQQIRPLRIDITTTLNKERNQVLVYFSSQDITIDSLYVVSAPLDFREDKSFFERYWKETALVVLLVGILFK